MSAKSSVGPSPADLDNLYIDLLNIREKVMKSTISSPLNLLLWLNFKKIDGHTDGRTKSLLGVTSKNKATRVVGREETYKRDNETKISEIGLDPEYLYKTYEAILLEIKRECSPFRKIGFYRPIGESKTYDSLEILYREANPDEKIQIFPINPKNRSIEPKNMISLRGEPLSRAASGIAQARSGKINSL